MQREWPLIEVGQSFEPFSALQLAALIERDYAALLQLDSGMDQRQESPGVASGQQLSTGSGWAKRRLFLHAACSSEALNQRKAV